MHSQDYQNGYDDGFGFAKLQANAETSRLNAEIAKLKEGLRRFQYMVGSDALGTTFVFCTGCGSRITYIVYDEALKPICSPDCWFAGLLK